MLEKNRRREEKLGLEAELCSLSGKPTVTREGSRETSLQPFYTQIRPTGKLELFIRECRGRTKGSGLNLKGGRFRINIREKFFTMSVVRHRNRLPRDVNGPCLEVFKARVDGASSLV